MRRPSFQFYPADWQGNTNLKRCTHAEKGMWVDLMCLLHDGEPYGVLRWPLEELAISISASVKDLRSIVNKGVLKGADVNETCDPFIYTPRSGRQNGPPVLLIASQPGPIWFSSRMIVDEHKRLVREKNFPEKIDTIGRNGVSNGAAKAITLAHQR